MELTETLRKGLSALMEETVAAFISSHKEELLTSFLAHPKFLSLLHSPPNAKPGSSPQKRAHPADLARVKAKTKIADPSVRRPRVPRPPVKSSVAASAGKKARLLPPAKKEQRKSVGTDSEQKCKGPGGEVSPGAAAEDSGKAVATEPAEEDGSPRFPYEMEAMAEIPVKEEEKMKEPEAELEKMKEPVQAKEEENATKKEVDPLPIPSPAAAISPELIQPAEEEKKKIAPREIKVDLSPLSALDCLPPETFSDPHPTREHLSSFLLPALEHMLDELRSRIRSLENEYPATMQPARFSLGLREALLEVDETQEARELYDQTEPSAFSVLVAEIIVILLGRRDLINVKDSLQSWANIKLYLAEQTAGSDICQYMLTKVRNGELEFSPQTVIRIKGLTRGRKLEDEAAAEKSGLTSVLYAAVVEPALCMIGVIGKGEPYFDWTVAGYEASVIEDAINRIRNAMTDCY